MSQPPSPEDQKRQVRANFNAMAPYYDTLRFVQIAAAKLLQLVDLQPGLRVLNIGTGTGMIALAAAQAVGPSGSVTAIDLSPEMIAEAQRKAHESHATNLEFRVGDAEHLDLTDDAFDVVTYGSSLFFVPDIVGALREARRVLVPGGRVAFTCFAASFMQPLRALWEAQVAPYGFQPTGGPHERLAEPDVCAARLREVGFQRVEALTEPLGFWLPNAETRWRQLNAGLEGVMFQRLTPDQQTSVKAAHLAELENLTTPQGIWFDVATNFAFGRK